MKYLPIIGVIVLIILLIRVFRPAIVSFLLKVKGKLTVAGIRRAIADADKDKAKTGRKNMVALNVTSGQFEPFQKKMLKAIANKNKNKSNAKQTEGRKRYQALNPKKKTYMTTDRVKKVEEKSLYITK